MMNLDNAGDFNQVTLTAVRIGMAHAGMHAPRLTSNEIMVTLSRQCGQFQYRRFHEEILNRAYGLAFINAKKMAWVRKQGM